MAITNNNKALLDVPFFELLNQATVASGATAAMTSSEDNTSRFIYYLSGTTFTRYDTTADTWQQLASPAAAPVTASRLRYTKNRGYHGRVISATSTSVTIPGLRAGSMDGATLRILQGTGIGQDRVLTYVGEITNDAGVITATTTATLVDSTKKWKVNQWAGYMVGITFGTNATQYKKVLYNDATTLTISDVNLMPQDPWNNQVYVAAAPYVLPVVTAGLQAHYQIMSSTYSVPSWTVTPDNSSFFTTLTGGIYLLSSAAAAPFITLQYYDVMHDSWQTKTVPQGLVTAAYGTDIAMERTGKIGSALEINTGAISSTNRTLSDAGKTLSPDRYNNHRIFLTGGTGAGQSRRIVGHTSNTFTIPRNWDINPASDTTYEIWADADRVYVGGGGLASMFAYSPENDYWMQGQAFDDGITANITATMNGWVPVGVSTGARIAAGVTAVASTPTAGGSNYVIGDTLTCSVGGTGAQVIVTSIAPGGVVTGVELVHSGTATGFTTGTGKATSGGTGTLCTINITSVGPTALITTASAHWYKAGNTITFAGCTEAAWNTAHTILGCPATTSFCVAITATANMAATASQSTTVIVDPSKNWIVNEHVGRLVHVMVAGLAPASQIRWITANTATTLTVGTITAGVNGTSKYVIYDSKVFGIDEQRKEENKTSFGRATGGSTTTLIDSTKNWVPNQWVGYQFKIEAGTGYGSGRISVLSNTETTLTYATQTFTPDSSSKYEIADTWGLITAATLNTVTETTTKNWVVNQWAGKRIRITGSALMGVEAAAASNTATALAVTVGTPDVITPYAILSIPARSTGIELIWVWGGSDANKKAKYIYYPRGGGSNTMDIYDITTGKFTFGTFFSPQAEGFTTGSSYSYDGHNGVYMTRSVANLPVRIFKYNVANNTFDGVATTTIVQNAVHIGNFLETIEDPSGAVTYIYSLQNTGTLLSRAMVL